MNLLTKLNAIAEKLNIPAETGVFSGVPPDEYVVFTPLSDTFELFADNKPLVDVSEVRISFFTRANYIMRTALIVGALFEADITITSRRYLGFESESRLHSYCIDVADWRTLETG